VTDSVARGGAFARGNPVTVRSGHAHDSLAFSEDAYGSVELSGTSHGRSRLLGDLSVPRPRRELSGGEWAALGVLAQGVFSEAQAQYGATVAEATGAALIVLMIVANLLSRGPRIL
jgi:hypothetical protein